MFNLIVTKIKPIIPNFFFNFLRCFLTAILTPFFFSYKSGHFYSSILKKAVNSKFEPIPWYTYPAIDFLNNLNLESKKVLEFGSGQSTLWWSKKTKEVYALEDNNFYFQKLRNKKINNIKIFKVETDLNNFNQINLATQSFDIIVVDGLDRYKCFQISLNLIKNDGIIVFDNSEGYHEKVDARGSFPILKLMNENNYKRVDFYGYAPGVIKKHCTSIFFKTESFIEKLNLNIERFN